jgi:hypothetical protein
MLQRGWGNMSAEEGGRGIPPGAVNKHACRQEQQHTPSNQEWESL